MILVADSGSTKCDWLLEQPGNAPVEFYTMGFNPMFHNSEFIEAEVLKNHDLCQYADAVTLIYYYGASVSSADRKEIVVEALRAVFKNAAVMAFHDLTGAVRATCGNEPGIVCILGTGSNSCYFDGKNVVEDIPALGYVLGDEAGGAWFGREFLRKYLYGLLSADVEYAIECGGFNKEEIYRRVYRAEGANVFLASFMPMIKKFSHDPAVQELLQQGFEEFFRYHIIPYSAKFAIPVHFVGSVGMYFKELITEICNNHQIQTGKFTNKPVEALYQYHLSNA